MWYIPIPYINLFFIIYSPSFLRIPPSLPPFLPRSTAGSFIVLLKSEREMTEKCIKPLLHFNINTGGVINIEAESVQERSDYKTPHCLIYGRQQQGSKVRFLPFSLSSHNTAVLNICFVVNNPPRNKKFGRKVIWPVRVHHAPVAEDDTLDSSCQLARCRC